MILELVKKAGEQKLSLKFTSINNEVQCEVIGEDSIVWYSYSSMDMFDLIMTVSDYLKSPEEFSLRLSNSVQSISDTIEEIVIGV